MIRTSNMASEHPEGRKGTSFRGLTGWQAATCGLLGAPKVAGEGHKDGSRGIRCSRELLLRAWTRDANIT